MNHKVCKTLSVSDGNYWWLIMPYQVQRVCWQSCGWYVNNIAKCVHLAPPGRWVIVSDRRAVLTTQIHSRQHLLGQRDSWVLSRYKQKQKHKYQKKGCWGKDILLSAIAVTAWQLSVTVSWVVSMQRWILFTSGGPHCDIAASCADRQEKYKHTNTNTIRIANMIQKIYTLATVIRRVFLGIRLRSLEFSLTGKNSSPLQSLSFSFPSESYI